MPKTKIRKPKIKCRKQTQTYLDTLDKTWIKGIVENAAEWVGEGWGEEGIPTAFQIGTAILTEGLSEENNAPAYREATKIIAANILNLELRDDWVVKPFPGGPGANDEVPEPIKQRYKANMTTTDGEDAGTIVFSAANNQEAIEYMQAHNAQSWELYCGVWKVAENTAEKPFDPTTV